MPNPLFRLQGATGFGLALFVGRFAQAVAFFVMARFLDPSQMGIVAILAVLFAAFFQMTNLGFDRYIVYSKNEAGPSFDAVVNAVWTLQLLRGLIILVAVVPVAFILNRFTDLNVGFWYVIGIASVVVTLSLVHPGLFAFERSGNFLPIARARALSVSAGGVSTVVLVLLWPFPWVYIVGQAVSALTLVGISYFLADGTPRVSRDPKHLSEAFSFGKHLIVIAIVSFLSAQAQHGYVGVLFGAATLGMYYTWERLVSLPRELVTQVTDRIMFATASDCARQGLAVGSAHLIGFTLTMAVMIPFNLFVWFHGDHLMALLAGDKWGAFFWVGQVFVLISFCYSMAGTIGPYMLVSYPHITSTLRSIEAFAVVGLMLVLGPKYGVAGVLAAVLTVIAFAVVARVFVLYRLIIRTDRLRHAAWMLGVLAGISGPILLWEKLALPFFPQSTQFVVAIIFYAVFLLSIAALAFPRRQLLLKKLS